MTDKLKPGTKTWEDRQRRHRHNGFSGFVCMMQQNLQTIIDADSTTEDTKWCARRMLTLSYDLAKDVKTRIDR